MKILFYIEPTWFVDKKSSSYDLLKGHFYYPLLKALIKFKQVDYKTIAPEVAHIKSRRETDKECDLKIIPLTLAEIKKPFGPQAELEDIFVKQYGPDGFSKEEEDYFKNLISSKLQGWMPDIIICFAVQSPFLKKLYPKALVLSVESGLFSSRAPFMKTFAYDPCGFGGRSFLNNFAGQIRTYKAGAPALGKLKNFKKELALIIEANNPLKPQIEQIKKKFSKLVLLPLCRPAKTSMETDFSHDFDYACFIMDNIPPNIGVIVTQHDIGAADINPGLIDFMKEKYPNFIYFGSDKWFASSSLYLYNHVDAVINLFSSTGLQAALLYDKKIIAMDKKYSHWYADKIGIENIEEFLAAPAVDKTNILAWYLTRYPVFLKRFADGKWLYNYLETKLAKFRKEGVTFDYYEEIEDLDEVLTYILSYVKNDCYNQKYEWMRRIYSVKYLQDGARRMRFLGLKIKLPAGR